MCAHIHHQYTGDTGKDVQALTTQVYNYTSNQFSLNFNYPYMGNSSNPPNCSDTDLVYGMTDLVNCSGNSPQLITNYLSQNVIPNSSLPSDVQRNASSDLNRTVNNFLQGQTTGWQSTKYHRQYNAKDKSVWAVDADFVWTCVQAVDYSATNPSSSLVLFMNFLGTTYPVKNAPSS